jgi:hypothetical protein
MDSFYLDNAVYRLEELLSTGEDPPAGASFEYGRRKPHCWIGYSPSGSGADMTRVEFTQVIDDVLKRNAPAPW